MLLKVNIKYDFILNEILTKNVKISGLTDSRARQVYWLVIFFVLFVYTITLLVANVNQYLTYGVITSTDLSYSLKLEFPAMTVCNQNRYLILYEYPPFPNLDRKTCKLLYVSEC